MKKQLSKEELLKPRIKVIAGWPQIKSMEDDVVIEAGDVLHEKKFGENPWFVKDAAGLLAIHPTWIDKYPHLFRRLEWWEERAGGELQYVRQKQNGKVYALKHVHQTEGRAYDVNMKHLLLKKCEPATEEEYEAAHSKTAK